MKPSMRQPTDYLKLLTGKMIYLAAPYSSHDKEVIEQRVKALCKVDAKLMKHGVFTMTPLSKHFILKYESLPGDWEYWQHYSRMMLKRADAVIVVALPGYTLSIGLSEELRDAHDLGLSIYYIDEDLLLLGEEHSKPVPPPGRIVTESGRVV
jgi:hypothetical protein